MTLYFYQVDAFTDRPFSGNPAAVVPLERPTEDIWMQAVAAEMNLSETAFLVPRSVGSWNLRWFTPTTEVSLCGHATLACAHVLFETGTLEADEEVVFHTRSGPLRVKRAVHGNLGEGALEMDFPDYPPEPWDPGPAALAALGLERDEVSWTGVSKHDADDWYALIEVPSASRVRALRPDFRALAETEAHGWIVTARAGAILADVDFVSRFFAPRIGVDEDPVTGSAHSRLFPYWQQRLGKAEMTARQVSARGGLIHGRHVGGRVQIIGRAVTTLHGQLLVSPP